VRTGGYLYSDIHGVRPEFPIHVDRAACAIAIVGYRKICLAIIGGLGCAAKLSVSAAQNGKASEYRSKSAVTER
jgi:hypothetical protein